MSDSPRSGSLQAPSRREFLKGSTAAVVAGSLAGQLALAPRVFAAGSDVLKVGLVGCGGRGTGAASQALHADPHVQLTAMGDAFADKLDSSLAILKNSDVADKVVVSSDQKFVGIDAYRQVIDSGIDIVILATPPHFRPVHLRYAVEKGKHSFVEKPVAVDGTGVRSMFATCELARQKNLAVVSGLCWRYNPGMRATFAKVLVRYNPDGDREVNRRQAERLARLSAWLHDRDRRFLFELLVPATPEQLKRAGGEQRRYDREIRPGLVVRIIQEMQDAGVEPDIWKIEGLDSAGACTDVVAAARAGGRDEVCCIVLGRGADEPQVIEWLRIAASVSGFDGFAVGRTLWEQPLRDWIAGTIDRSAAVDQIAARYLETVSGFVA